MADSLNIFGLDDIPKAAGREIQQVISTRMDIQKAIDCYSGTHKTIETAIILAGYVLKIISRIPLLRFFRK